MFFCCKQQQHCPIKRIRWGAANCFHIQDRCTRPASPNHLRCIYRERYEMGVSP